MLFLRTTSKRRVAKGARRTHAFIHRSGSTVAATVGERKHVEKRIAFDLEPPIAGHQSFMKRFGRDGAARLLPSLRLLAFAYSGGTSSRSHNTSRTHACTRTTSFLSVAVCVEMLVRL
jgi:hypothetical protein